MNQIGLQKNKGLSLSSLLQLFLSIYVLLLPIGTGLSGIVGRISLLNYFSFVIILAGLLICVRKGSMMIPYYALPTILYGIYTVISFAWAPSYRVSWYIATNFVNVLMIVVLASCKFDKEDFLSLDKWIAASQLVVFAAVLGNIQSIYKYRLTIRVVSTIGINDFACGLCLLSAFWMSLASGKNRMQRTWAYICLGLDLAIIFLAGSRGALMMFLAMVLVWIVFGNYSKGAKILTVAVVVIAIVFFSTTFFSLLPKAIRSRLSLETIQSTHGSGRFIVWTLAFQRFLDSNPLQILFGHGFNSFAGIVQYGSYGGVRDLMAHNVVVQTMIEGGLTGLVFLALMVFSQFKIAWKRNDTFMKIALVGLFVSALSTDMQVTRIWGFILALNLMRNRLSQWEVAHLFMD